MGIMLITQGTMQTYRRRGVTAALGVTVVLDTPFDAADDYVINVRTSNASGVSEGG